MNTGSPNSANRIADNAFRVLLVLFCASIFTSKAGVALFGLPLIILSGFMVNWRNLAKEFHLILGLSLYPLAALLNYFSLGGIDASIKVLYSWPWLLLLLPAYVLRLRPEHWVFALTATGAGAALGSLIAIYKFFKISWENLNSFPRIAVFWDISRWGVFLSIGALSIFGLIFVLRASKAKESMEGDSISTSPRSSEKTYLLWTLFGLLLIALWLSNTRAPWLAFGMSSVFFSILVRESRRALLVTLTLIVLAAASLPSFRNRIATIGAVKHDTNGKITSSDESNKARLNMWKVAIDFGKQQPLFGTGFEMAERPFRDFLAAQSPDYLDHYITSEFSYRDQHSSYLWTYVQMGVIFSLLFWGYLLGITILLLKDYLRSKSPLSALALSVQLSFAVMNVFYSNVTSYEMIALVPWIVLISGPRLRLNQRN